jgi:hypothetical protein
MVGPLLPSLFEEDGHGLVEDDNGNEGIQSNDRRGCGCTCLRKEAEQWFALIELPCRITIRKCSIIRRRIMSSIRVEMR